MGQLLKLISDTILKAIPFEGHRTTVIAVGQLIYAISGVISGSLSHDQAGVIATTALGLLFSKAHVNKH